MWGYGLPFGNYCTEYWFWHDYWYVLLFVMYGWSEFEGIVKRIIDRRREKLQ